jgi:hypothetical protein
LSTDVELFPTSLKVWGTGTTSSGETIGTGGRGLFLKSFSCLYLPFFSIDCHGVLVISFGSLSLKTPASTGLMIEYVRWSRRAAIGPSELSPVEYPELQLDLDDIEP